MHSENKKKCMVKVNTKVRIMVTTGWRGGKIQLKRGHGGLEL